MAKVTVKELQTQLADAKQEAMDFKKEVQRLRGELNKFKTFDEEVDLKDLPNKALGFIRMDKTYYQVNLRFDAECQKAVVESKHSLGTSFPTATGRIRKDFAIEILDEARRK